MTGRIWLYNFMQSCKELEDKSDCDGRDWTEFMYNILDKTAIGMNCYVVRKRQDKSNGEYLNIDAFYFDDPKVDLPTGKSGYKDPYVLPSAVVELENQTSTDKITYCLWKLLCIRSPVRALVCYQKGMDNVMSLSKHLEDVIWQRSLLKGDNGNLYVIIGDDRKKEKDWQDYFTIFEWRSDKLIKIENLEVYLI